MSPKHNWVSFSGAVDVSFCWILSEINWKRCAGLLLHYRRGGQPVTCEPSAAVALLLLRLPWCPAAELGRDRPPWIWGEEPCIPHVPLSGKSCYGAVSAPASGQLHLPRCFAVCRAGTGGLGHRKILICGSCSLRLGALGLQESVWVFFPSNSCPTS